MSLSPRKIVLVDVDTQADFMLPQGKLYVPGAEKIIPNLERLMQFAQQNSVPVISSADAHTPDDEEFHQFPPHCVKGTAGQEKIPETLLTGRTVLGSQKQPLPAESEFSQIQQWILEKQKFDLFTNPNAAPLLERLAADEYIVFGVATDYCVKAAAWGLLRMGRRVGIVADAIQGIDPGGSQATLHELQSAGARLLTTQEVVSQVKAA